MELLGIKCVELKVSYPCGEQDTFLIVSREDYDKAARDLNQEIDNFLKDT